MTASTPTDAWLYDQALGVYFHSPSATYAIPDPITGQWSYVAARDFRAGESSSTPVESTGNGHEREEGEVEDDVGWGGLMEPDELDAVIKKKRPTAVQHQPGSTSSSGMMEKHPAYSYDDPKVFAFPARDASPPPKEMPKHLLRLVVLKSNVVTMGDVAIIDAREGGVQIGRDRCEKGGQARVRLKEMEVSKTHAVVYWGEGGNEDEERWWIVDLGSTHGTYVQSDIDSESSKTTRLSDPKSSSKPYPLSHLSTISIGSTTFGVHVHPSWPCDLCQVKRDNEMRLDDGTCQVVAAPTPPVDEPNHATRWAMDSKEKRDNREIKRKREMATLRETLLKKSAGNESSAPISREETPERQYLDRSAMRRRLHPPSPPPQTDSRRSASPPIRRLEPVSAESSTPSAFASNMLANQGWTPGMGLGRHGDGRADPINVEMRTEKRGLGAQGSKAVVDTGNGDWRQRGKHRRWEEEAAKTG